ncbi:MAG: hypothetical protein K2X47_07620 [Bdellovibrionales bacterium]|nr:hypothetical protein [Bdellovibrionales bacterium]
MIHHFSVGEYYNHPQAAQILKNIIGYFMTGMENGEENLVIKLSSWDLYVAEMFLEIFPNAQFYFNTRNFEDVYQSLVEEHPAFPIVPKRLREQSHWGTPGRIGRQEFPLLLEDYQGILQKILISENSPNKPIRKLIVYESLRNLNATDFFKIFELDSNSSIAAEYDMQQKIYSKDVTQTKLFEPRRPNNSLLQTQDPTYERILKLCGIQADFLQKYELALANTNAL